MIEFLANSSPLLFYSTGVFVWVVIGTTFSSLIAYLLIKQIWYIIAAFWFLCRRFYYLEHGGFDKDYNAIWLFLSRWFLYAFFPSWRLDWVEDTRTGRKVYWPFCGPEDWRKRTVRFDRIK